MIDQPWIQGLMENSDQTQKAGLAKPLRTGGYPEFLDDTRWSFLIVRQGALDIGHNPNLYFTSQETIILYNRQTRVLRFDGKQ